MDIGENIRRARKMPDAHKKNWAKNSAFLLPRSASLKRKIPTLITALFKKSLPFWKSARYPCTIRNHLKTCFKEPTLTQSIFPLRKQDFWLISIC